MPGLSPFPTAVQQNFSSPGHTDIPHKVEGAAGLWSQTPVPRSLSLPSLGSASTPPGITLVEFPHGLSNTRGVRLGLKVNPGGLLKPREMGTYEIA